MNKLVIGPGACGFLRMNHLLQSVGMPTSYKGGRVKYQNGFETWNPSTGLIWDSHKLTPEDRLKRAKHYLDNVAQGKTEIAHYSLPYIKELVAIDPNIRILCLDGNREHTIKSLFTHWGYMNPLTERRGEYRARYPLEQYSEFTSDSYEVATRKWVENYYETCIGFSKMFPKNFLVINPKNLFEPETDGYQTRKLVSEFFNNANIISAPVYPIDYESHITTVTNHGGLGNSAIQQFFCVGFCKEFNLPKPIFGTWKLWNGGGLFPIVYNADRFLGGHTGTHQDMKDAFQNLDWKGELEPSFDTKFMINDMFASKKFFHMRKEIIEAFKPSEQINKFIDEKYGFLYNKPTISLHFRFCSLGADSHINGVIPFKFHEEALNSFSSDDMNVLVFSDNNAFASQYIFELKKVSKKNFVLIDENQFKSLFMISQCNHHIMHVSTFSFVSSFLSTEEGKTFYHKEFETCHTNQMIHPNLNWIRMDQ